MYTLHKQLSSNTDVTMLVTVCEPVIRNQCATTKAMAHNANLNLTSSDVTHVMLTIYMRVFCCSYIGTKNLSQIDAVIIQFIAFNHIHIFSHSTDYPINVFIILSYVCSCTMRLSH